MIDVNFLKAIDILKKSKQFEEREIAELFGMTTIEMRKKISNANRINREELRQKAVTLRDDGYTVEDIAKALGKNESSIKLLLSERMDM